VPLVPLLAIVSCGYLMFQLPWVTWERFVLWLLAGLVIYMVYGIRHSTLRAQPGPVGQMPTGTPQG
jgi:APA family basic amino acid/polyamine antiporter